MLFRHRKQAVPDIPHSGLTGPMPSAAQPLAHPAPPTGSQGSPLSLREVPLHWLHLQAWRRSRATYGAGAVGAHFKLGRGQRPKTGEAESRCWLEAWSSTHHLLLSPRTLSFVFLRQQGQLGIIPNSIFEFHVLYLILGYAIKFHSCH